MAYSLDATGMGEIQSEDVTVTIQTLDWQPITGGTNETEIIVLSAPKRIFDVNAMKVDSITDNKDWNDQLITWVQQATSVIYVSDMHTDATGVNVKVMNVNSNYVAGNPRILNYSVKLVEADSVF